MNRVKMTAEVEAFKDKDLNGDVTHLTIHSHWNWGNAVVLVIGGDEYALYGGDLILAIENCMRSRR